MSTKIRLEYEDDCYQLFGNNDWPPEFDEFLEGQGVKSDIDGCFDPTHIDPTALVEWLNDYAEKLYIELSRDNIELIPIRNFYDPNDRETLKYLSFSDRLEGAMDSSTLLEVYFVREFLKKHKIAICCCGDVKPKENYDKLLISRW